MNLRFLIFFTVSAIGTFPLVLFLLFSLPSSIHQLNLAAQQETMALSRIHFSHLNSRISCLEKSIKRLAIVPVSLDVVSDELGDEVHSSRLEHLVVTWFQENDQIREIQFLDLVGNERFRMVRTQAELSLVGSSGLENHDQAPAFLLGLHLSPNEVFVGVASEESRRNQQGSHDFFMVTPVTGQGSEMAGLLVLLVELPTFLEDFRDALWVLADGSMIHHPEQFNSSFVLPDRVSDPAVQAETEPFIQTTAEQLQLSWLPISFNKDQRPVMWIGRLVDLSNSLQWKASMLQNLLIIVVLTALSVFALAHFMSSRLMLVKQDILNGLDQLLNHDKSVCFSWRGPAELRNLARDLSHLGELYLHTRLARQEAEAARLESEEKFRNLTESAHDAIIFMDHHGDVTYWNKAAESFFGYTAAEAMGQPIHALISLSRSEGGEDMGMSATRAGSQVDEMLELTATRKDGREILLELSLSAISINDSWHASWIVRDISERKKAAAAALFQQQQLIQADKMISLGLLVSGVAHEINNPNSIVMLNNPMLLRAWQSVLPILEEFYEDNGDFLVAGLDFSEMREQVPRLFSEIDEGARKIKGIVLDLKDYARQESSALQQPMDLNQVADAAVRLTRNAVKNSTHHFQLKLASELPPIMGNMQRLEQVVINLIQNSCEALAGPEKEITLVTSFEADKGQVVLRLEDEGCGIDSHAMGKVCDPFYTTKRSMGGTGLGLSVSAGIMKEHHGQLAFAPRPGGGTIVTMVFPLKES